MPGTRNPEPATRIVDPEAWKPDPESWITKPGTWKPEPSSVLQLPLLLSARGGAEGCRTLQGSGFRVSGTETRNPGVQDLALDRPADVLGQIVTRCRNPEPATRILEPETWSPDPES